MLRAVAFLVGVGLLGAAAHINILAGGGYADPQAIAVLAIAASVAVSAIVIGAAWGERRRWLAGLLLITLTAGEAYNLNATAERVIAGREVKQAPLRAHKKRRAEISAKIAHIRVPETSDRLQAALANQRKIAADVSAKADKRNCARNCRALLETATENASAEVVAAREELVAQATAAIERRERLESELAALPAPVMHSPLAERLGAPPWLWDVIIGALGSLALNGSACLLLAYAARGTHSRLPLQVESAAPIQFNVAVLGLCDEWAASNIRPHKRRCVRIDPAYRAFSQWCAENGHAAVDGASFASAFAELIRDAGIAVRIENGAPVVVGACLAAPAVELKALPALPAPA